MKNKIIFTAFATLLLGNSAWCSDSAVGTFVKDAAIIGASTTGCAGGVLLGAGLTRGQYFKAMAGGCAAGGVIGGAVAAGIGEALADDAPTSRDLEANQDNEE